MPPGLVTRTISSAIVHGSGTCSSTLEEKQMSMLPVRNGSCMPLPRTVCPLRGAAVQAQLSGVRVQREIGRAAATKGIREESRAAPDVQQQLARKGRVVADVRRRIGRHQTVEVRRVGLLDAESAKQGAASRELGRNGWSGAEVAGEGWLTGCDATGYAPYRVAPAPARFRRCWIATRITRATTSRPCAAASLQATALRTGAGDRERQGRDRGGAASSTNTARDPAASR